MTKYSILYERGTQGQLILSAIIDGQRIHKQYFGYSRAEARARFKQEVGLL